MSILQAHMVIEHSHLHSILRAQQKARLLYNSRNKHKLADNS